MITGYERLKRYRIRQKEKGHLRLDIYLPLDAWCLLDEMQGTKGEAISDAIRCAATIREPEWQEVYLLFRQGKIRAIA